MATEIKHVEIILGEAGEKLMKVCGGNQVAFGRIVEQLISQLTMGELIKLIDVLKLDNDSDI